MPVLNVADLPTTCLSSDGWTLHTSPSVPAGFAAARAVASVQTALPLGSAERLELQVRTSRNQSRWSPWLTLMSWRGTDAPEPPAAWRGQPASPAGRVVVDQYRADSAHLFRFLQVRVAATQEVAPRRLAAAIRSDVLVPAEGAAGEGAVATVGWQGDRPAPFCQFDHPREGGRICSPASVAWACAALRGERDLALDRVMARVHDAEHDIYGNWPRAIAVAGERGVAGRLAYVDGPEAARAWLAEGRLVVASIRFDDAGALPGAPKAMPEGHLIVVLGDDPAGDVVQTFDPARPAADPFPHLYPRGAFYRAWVGRSALAYVLGPAA